MHKTPAACLPWSCTQVSLLNRWSERVQKKGDPHERKKLNVIQRNGYRLLRMVDQLLNLETFRVKAITQKTPQAIGQTIQLIAEAFVDLAEEKSIKLEVGNIIDVNFEFTPDAMEKIVLNLLSILNLEFLQLKL